MTQAATAGATATGPRFQRANYLVSDLNKALVLYRDILGMHVEFTKDSPQDSYSYPVFGIDPSLPLGFAVLGTPTQPRVMALTEVRTAQLPAQPEPRRAAIVIHVDDIDAIVAVCKTADLHVFPEERLETNDGRVGREVGILDPDGNLVVIYHIPENS